LWSFAIVFDIAWGGYLATFSARTPVALAAIWAMCRPSSQPRFLLLAAAQAIVAALGQPDPGNHWFFMIVVHATIGLALIVRPRASTLERLYARFAPALRAEVVVLYTFAALAKFNSSFLVRDLSCVGLFYRQLAGHIPLFPEADWALGIALFSTIVIESTIPLLLAFRRTGSAGVLLAVGFHLLLAIGGAPSFSVAAFALLSLFLPPEVFRSAAACFRKLLRYVPPNAAASLSGPLPFVVLAALVLAPAVSVWVEWLPVETMAWGTSRIFWALWLLGGSFLAGLLLSGFVAGEGRRLAPATARAILPLLWIGPALAVANGLSPYAGAKTENTFTMFSNLRTEGEHWNHLLIPRSVRVLGLQDELVHVIASSAPELKAFTEPGVFLVATHFHEITSGLPDASVTYESGGRIHQVARIADVPLLSRPPGWPGLRKLLVFRPVDTRGVCQH
jgi:hypothetical protein